MKTGKRRNLRGEPEKRRGGRRRLEEDGKERIAKERQPLFAITDRCGLPGLDVRTEDTGLRSDQSFRCASCGTARLIGFGVDSPSKSRVTTSISIESSDIIASSIAQAARRQSRQDQSERSSDEDEKSLLFAGGGCRKGSWGDVGEARRAAGRTVESSKNEFLACRTVCSFVFLVFR